MELVFILLDILGIIVSLCYYRRGIRNSAILTVVIAALTLIRVTWIRVLAGACIVFITICFVLFQTKFGTRILALFGLDAKGRRPGHDKPEQKSAEAEEAAPAESGEAEPSNQSEETETAAADESGDAENT